MSSKEILLIIAVIISFYFMYEAFQIISQLSDEGKISKSKRSTLIYFATMIPIIGWMQARYEQKKYNRNR
ncbi:MAG: hypothetical protein IE931_11660 [Sphingobacteriales bacterium]|nr:hypothetical protein [Sphingobacteriales bacterium]